MKKSLRSKSFITTVLFIISFVFFSIATIILSIKINHDNKTVRTFNQFSIMPPVNQGDEIFVTLHKTTKFVSDEGAYKIIYEGKFVNNTKNDLEKWEILIQVPETVSMLNTWNCDSAQYGKYVLFTPKNDNTKIIHKNETLTLGFMINSLTDLEITELTFSGCLVQNIFTNPLFIVLLFLILLDIFVFTATKLVHRYMLQQIKLLRNQKERDDLLIEQTMKTFVQCIDAKDEYTRGHSARVANYSRAIAKQLGYDEKFQQDMYYMGLMHDIGKLAVPDNILNKTTRLSNEEWEIIQLHTTNGARMLKEFSIMPELKDAVLYHHERYDGKGYVNQLKGDAIPLCARIICVADSFDAMNTNRCYRLKFSKERIINEIERCSGKQFDPTIVPAMVELIKSGEIEKL